MSNPEFEDECVNIVQERKDNEENLLFILLEEEKQNNDFLDEKECDEIERIKIVEENLLVGQIQEEIKEICSYDHNEEENINEIENELYEEIEKRKDAEDILLVNQIQEETKEICSYDHNEEENINETENEPYEEIEKRKDVEEILLFNQLKEEDNEIFETKSIVDESDEEIEKRKEAEEELLKYQLEEENFDNYIDELNDEAKSNEINEELQNEIEMEDDIDVNELLLKIEEEQNNDFNSSKESDVKRKENSAPTTESNIFPIPDCISCSSNDEKRSVTSITENENNANIPGETPFRHKSMIPVQTGRKIPLPREVFETPSFRTQGRDKFDPHLLSEMKPKQKNGSKLHSSIPVNQGRKQNAKKSKVQKNKKDSKDEKESQQPAQKKNTTQKRNVVNKKSIEEENKKVVFTKEQPPKTISKKQLKNMAERLAPITPAAGKQQVTKEHPEKTVDSLKSIPQTPSCSTNSDIFNRLFVMSTCKKKMPNAEEEKVEDAETEEKVQPILSAKSNHLALKKDIVKISSVVGEVDECDKANLERIMKELKIVDSTTTDEEMEMIEKEYSQCLVDVENNIYSAKQLETRILDSISLKKHRKFNNYVNRRLAIVRANEKPVIAEKTEEKPEPVKRPTTMQRVTFDRLIAVKPNVSESDNQNGSDITLKKETEQVKLSKASQFILQKSQRTQEIMSMPLDQRDSYLMKKRNESIQKLEESLQQQEEKELKTKPSNLGALPRFYEQFQQEIKQRQPKQNQNKKGSEKDSFKPKTMSYNDFQKMKEKIYGSEPKIAGVEERIKRLRLARIERNELQEALDPRALPTELKNIKKKKNPAKKNVNMNLSTNQEEVQDCPINEHVDAVDNVLGI